MKFNKEDWLITYSDGTKGLCLPPWLGYLLMALLFGLIAWAFALIQEHQLWGYVIIFFLGWLCGDKNCRIRISKGH